MAKGNQRDYYEVLGVSRTAAVEEIKSAYRKAALKWHPDRNPENKADAEVNFRECTEAYSVLSDPQKRQLYDTYGHAGLSSAGAAQGFDHTVFQDFHDIFGDFFGFDDLFGGSGRRRRTRARARRARVRAKLCASAARSAAARDVSSAKKPSSCEFRPVWIREHDCVSRARASPGRMAGRRVICTLSSKSRSIPSSNGAARICTARFPSALRRPPSARSCRCRD